MPGFNRSRSAAGALLPLLLLCLFARALVPAGWMPSFTAQGIALIPCTGVATAPTAHSGHGAEHDHSGKAEHDVGGQPCSFAAAAADLPATTGAAAAAIPPQAITHLRERASVRIGQGLAAPPPPSTGPPITA